MNSTKKQARVAGLLYLLASIIGFFCLAYVPGKLIVSGDATATANRIRASETLLRLGIASELIAFTIFIFVVLALYRLFKAVSEKHAVAMATLLLISIPISLLNLLNEIAALVLVSGASFLSAFEKGQLDALAYMFLRLHGQGFIVAQIFWGLWLFPFGILVIRSGFIPRFLGYLLFIAASGYLASSFTSLLLPSYRHLVDQFAMVLEAGELPIIFWLLIWGAKVPLDRPPLDPAIA
ncbi:MAG: DUF4386 domain-containing protein [Verrucomicrobia bacterium]|jgi:hypothetical protein|nr:MAG: DUF4386 domain-containing protein [Verrucomicrobiota bacterium]